MQKLYDREQDLTAKLENHLKTVELQIKTLDKYGTNSMKLTHKHNFKSLQLHILIHRAVLLQVVDEVLRQLQLHRGGRHRVRQSPH